MSFYFIHGEYLQHQDNGLDGNAAGRRSLMGQEDDEHSTAGRIPPTPYVAAVALPAVTSSRVASDLLTFGSNTWLYSLGLDQRNPNLARLIRNNTPLVRILATTAVLPEDRQVFVRDPLGLWGNRTVDASNLHYVSCMDVVVGFWRHVQEHLTVEEYNMNMHTIGHAAAIRAITYGSLDLRRVDRLGESFYLAGFIWNGNVLTAVLSNGS